MVNDTASVGTFADTKIFGGIYFYTYVLITLVIMFGAYYFSGQVALYRQSYRMLRDIEFRLGKIRLAMKGLERKFDPNTRNDKKKEVDCVDLDLIHNLINEEFTGINDTIQQHKQFLLNKAATIDKHASDPGIISDENKDNSTGTSNEKILVAMQSRDRQSLELKVQQTSEMVDRQDSKQSTNKAQKSSENINTKQQQLNNFLEKEYAKLRINNTKGIKSYFKILWDLRSLLIAVIAHFFDTASDIALILEWYILQQKQSNDKNYLKGVDMTALFYCSLSVLVYYRIESMLEVYRFSQSPKDAILQFFFDFYLIKAIYVNIYRMHSYKALSFVKIIRSLEGSTESTFQAILALVFLIKTDWNEVNDTTALISLVTSLYSLISRLQFQDSSFLKQSAKESNLEFEDIFSCKCAWICKINPDFINFSLFRTIDTLTTMFGIALFWHILGGFWVVIVFGPQFTANTFQNKATAISSNLLTITLHDYGVTRKIKSMVIYKFERYYRAKCFISFRIAWMSTLMILTVIDVFVSNDTITNYNQSKWNSYVLFWVSTLWLSAVFVLPIWYMKCIVNYIVPKKERTTVSRHFSIRNAILANDIEFVEFARFMGVRMFFTPKLIQFYINWRFCVRIHHSSLCSYCKRKYKRRIFRNRLIYAFIDAGDNLNDEMYYFFRDWYNEPTNWKDDEHLMMNFEQYLMCTEKNKYIELLKTKNNDTFIARLLKNSGVLESDEIEMYSELLNANVT